MLAIVGDSRPVTIPQLVPLLPAIDLDRLDLQHASEEGAEMSRRLVDLPRPMHITRPAGGKLPVSDWFNPSAPAIKSGEIVPDRKRTRLNSSHAP